MYLFLKYLGELERDMVSANRRTLKVSGGFLKGFFKGFL